MFPQTVATLNWCSNADPETIVTIGPDAIGILSDNVVICYNHKDASKLHFKADNPQVCAGISILTGHPRYPLFAVVEAVLRPNIYIISYPDMEKVTTMENPNSLSYIDAKLSDFHYLASLEQYPPYKLAFWDIRTGEHLGETSTHKSSRYALDTLKTEVEVVKQYSAWTKQVSVWQLVHSSSSQNIIKLVSLTDLGNNFEISSRFKSVFHYNERIYVVNDDGDVVMADLTHMTVVKVWSTPHKTRGSHHLFCDKNGLLILNSEAVYYIKNLRTDLEEWKLAWTLDNTDRFVKAIVDYNNNIRLSTSVGNIYRIQHSEQTVSVVPDLKSNCNVIDYVFLKGVKDEVVLLLIEGGDLQVVDLMRKNVFSNYTINGALSISSHNSYPFVAVGTATGVIHFLSYEKVRAPPVEMESVQITDSRLDWIGQYEDTVFIKDDSKGLHIMFSDYRAKTFRLELSLASESTKNWSELDMFLLDERRAIMFLKHLAINDETCSTEAWLYNWIHTKNKVKCAEFPLPYNYRRFTVLQLGSTEIIEFMGLRTDYTTIDIFSISTNNTMSMTSSVQSTHFGSMTCIMGNRHILTVCPQCLVMHFRLHKKSRGPYSVARPLISFFTPTLLVKADECFNAKFLLSLDIKGRLACFRLPLLFDSFQENQLINYPEQHIIEPTKISYKPLKHLKSIFVPDVTEKDKEIKEKLLKDLDSIGKEMRDLIIYDLEVIGQKAMKFQKFCLNHKWLVMLKEEARILCETQRDVLLHNISDQSRIRDWISDFISSKNGVFKTKLRSIASVFIVESYSTRPESKELLDKYDQFRFYDMEPVDDDLDSLYFDNDPSDSLDEEGEERKVVRKPLKHYVIEKGASVYDHVMAKDFELQDIRIVTLNQQNNEESKLTIIITDSLKAEFNKSFIVSKNFKEETMDNILVTNATLQRIYSNMNCMRCLLKMDSFVPPQISVPEWQKDESIIKLLTVDDSEIKAINRRKKAMIAAKRKSDRMLLWDLEFFERALIIMMDGVVEKLWEEEIKKTPLLPESIMRKQMHEYTLEDQRLYREYEQKLTVLEQDRKKYLRILHDNEIKTQALKKRFILKLNENIAAITIKKIQYDFAINHERLRLLIVKLTTCTRIQCRKEILQQREKLNKLREFISRHEHLMDGFERAHSEFKTSHDAEVLKNKQLDRQFNGNFLNMIPPALTAEIIKIYKKRPKVNPKVFCSESVCSEMSRRIDTKKPFKFPLPPELIEFLNTLKALDNRENCPNQLEPKHWEIFIQLRRKRVGSEIRLRGLKNQIREASDTARFFEDNVRTLKNLLQEANITHMKTMEQYFDAAHNQRLELVLEGGQIELHARASVHGLNNAVLMHVDDINDLNETIKETGKKKIKAMQRVALFRRKVVFKEWEHKVCRANIEYLKYILHLVEKCKVSLEFLDVIRNWHKVKDLKATTQKMGLLEEIIGTKVVAAKDNLRKLEKRIDKMHSKVHEIKLTNFHIDDQIINFQADLTYTRLNRDILFEERNQCISQSRLDDAMEHGRLSAKVKADYVKILELKTILEIMRRRTFENLPPAKEECRLRNIEITEVIE